MCMLPEALRQDWHHLPVPETLPGGALCLPRERRMAGFKIENHVTIHVQNSLGLRNSLLLV